MADKSTMLKVYGGFLFVVFIIFLSVGALVSTDIFLPSLPEMAKFYHTSISNIQSAISVFLASIAIAQLFYGPLSDSLGRKKTLFLGLAIWLMATIAILFVAEFKNFLILRSFQGIGACAGLTIGRAIINDKYDAQESAHFYLIIFPFVGMSPAIAPMIGGILAQYWGWKACFVFLSFFIFLTLWLCGSIFEESLPKEKRHKFHFSLWLKNIQDVLFNKTFLYFAFIPCFAYGAYFAYIVESPFLLTKLGLPAAYVGYTYLLVSFGYVCGNIVAKTIARRYSVLYSLNVGYRVFFISGLLFFLQMVCSPWPLVTSIIVISFLTFGNGFLLPLGTSLAISSHRKAFGAASGVMGALQLASAALSSFFIGKISYHVPLWVAFTLTVLTSLGFLIYLLGKRR